ncbi:MAG: TIGR03032 family protein [Actinomycetota bacterium]|nr:TIGR03032 family protein [Actinomycetota bacterium]
MKGDEQHLNSVASVDGGFLIAGFGRRPPGASSWRAATRGFVRSVPDGNLIMAPLYHPHSICRLARGEVAVCESPRRHVVTSEGRVSDPLPGYARGLLRAGDKLYAGTSRHRRPSEPASILDYGPATSEIDDGACSVCQLDAATLGLESVIPLDPHGREVYDIVALPEYP